MQLFNGGGLSSSRYLPFIGSKLSQTTVEANIRFIEKYMDIELQRRVITDVEIDKKLIRNGDLLMSRRLDGFDASNMIMTGGHIAHAAVALWEGTELWVVESQAAWYFQTKINGVQKTKYDDWLDLAQDGDLEVVWLPLSDDLSTTFDSKKAWSFYAQNEHLPYGYRTAVFTVIDTVEGNYPEPVSSELIPFAIRYVQ